MKYVILNQLIPIRRSLDEGYEFHLVPINITLNTAKEVEFFIKNNAIDVYLDFLIDREEKEIEVCGQSFPASFVMRMIDPIAYKKMFKEFLNEIDIAKDIEKIPDGETTTILEFNIRAEK